jgi:carboxypeptidase Taq
MNERLEQYFNYRKKLKAYQYALYVIGWDSETEAPVGCFEYRGDQIGVLVEEIYKIETSETYMDVVAWLFEHQAELDPDLCHEIKEVKKQIDKTKKIPMDKFIEFQVLLSKSQNIWADAKNKNDFKLFKPTLAKIIDYLRQYIKYLENDTCKGYNILLDEYEPGMTIDDYDRFFGELKLRLVPFVKKVLEHPMPDDFSFAHRSFPVEGQKKFCTYLQDVLCFDRNHGLMKESEHPFTSGSGSFDVRFTNHYYPELVTSAIFSAIHEMGHALYEQQCDPKFNHTFSSGGASLALHESQSRLFENILGRDLSFWRQHYPFLQQTFPEQLKDVTVEQFYRYINQVEGSYIRTEADELTYSLHIMLRYDLEKAIFTDQVSIDELEGKWNELFYQYFGMNVPDAKNGILQDVHWSSGMFGYFPTYALGSATSAQIYHHMKKDLPVEEILATKNTKEINEWLKVRIHQFASSKYPKEILMIALQEPFNVSYYIDYLIQKYSSLYGIDSLCK